MEIRKIAKKLYEYTYPRVQYQYILDLISENYAAWEGKAWEQTMKYYKKTFGHSWKTYIYKKLDYPDLYNLDTILSFKGSDKSLKEGQAKLSPGSLSGSNT